MSDASLLLLGTAVLALVTHIVLAPERYLRRVRRDAYATLFELTGHDRSVTDRLVLAEVERGARSRDAAARAALARLLRDRHR